MENKDIGFTPNFPLPATIQQEAFKSAKKGLTELVRRKTKTIKWLEDKELTDQSYKKIEALREEVKMLGAYMIQYDDYLNAVYGVLLKEEDKITMLQNRCDFLQTEVLDYMEKYNGLQNKLLAVK